LIAALVLVGLMVASCGWKPPGMASQKPDTCTDADGPTPDTVRLAIDTLSVATPGSGWTEAARGHARKCRLYWVQVKPTDATASSPAQLLFFDHSIPLGTPTPNPKPYTSVLYSTDDVVRVQYQWQVAGDSACCPTGIGTVQYQIGPNGKLVTRGTVPNQ
jgi:LppP/LprE lipoprotein